MRFVVWAMVAAITIMIAKSANANEKLASCSGLSSSQYLEAPCSLNWVEHQTRRSLTWSKSTDDYGLDIHKDENGRYQVHSQNSPNLLDVDQDGWTDLVFFTLIGMVNGDYDFYRFDPDQGDFVTMGKLNGSDFYLDKNGFIVADIRSNCCEREVVFYQIKDHRLTPQFRMQIRPQEMSVSTQQCELDQSPNGPDLDRVRSLYPKMIEDYCNYYQEKGWETIQTRSLDRKALLAHVYTVPEHTVFYCQLEDTLNEVTVTYHNGIYTYRFGPIGKVDADLELQREASAVDVLPDNGAGTSRFGYIGFQNGDYTYRVHYANQIFLKEYSADVSETIRGLVVQRGDETAFVFDKLCVAKTAFDQISALN